MILVLERNDLAAALGRVASIVDRAQTIPILSNVMLSASDDTLTIRATNLNMEAVETISAAVGEPGQTTVSAPKLSELARSLSEGAQIGMKLAERLAVTSGRSRFNLATLPVQDFPQLWAEEWPISFTTDAATLADMLTRVAYAQSEEASRAYIQGVNLRTVEGRLRAIGTNTHIIAYVDGGEVPEIGAQTVPTRMVTEMSRLLAGHEGAVQIGLSDAKISLTVGATTITSKLIDRSLAFPDYQRAIPKETPSTVTVDVGDLSAAIRRAMIASQGVKDNTVWLEFKSGAVAVTARNTEADAMDEIDAEYEGEPVKVALNPPYLLGVLGAIPTESVEVGFSGPMGAMTWRPTGDAAAVAVMAPQGVKG